MSVNDRNEEQCLRKKYSKRPSHVIRIKFLEPIAVPALPVVDDRRMWYLTEQTIVVKTWRSIPLPDIVPFIEVTGSEVDTLSVEYNAAPHPKDKDKFHEISKLKCAFCLEFREHWAGHYSSNSIKKRNEGSSYVSISCNDRDTVVDDFLEPFFINNTYSNIRVLTGRFSILFLGKLPLFYSLQFLGLRANYEEYATLAEVISFCGKLQRIHLMPQWEYASHQKIPTIRFNGILHVYYWDLETTKAIKKAHRKWKKQQNSCKCFWFFKYFAAK